MTVHEIAKEITIAAINNNMLGMPASNNSNPTAMSASIAENVAAFYNKLVEEISKEK